MYKDMYIYIYNPYEEEKMSYIYGVIFFMITFEVLFVPSHIDYFYYNDYLYFHRIPFCL